MDNDKLQKAILISPAYARDWNTNAVRNSLGTAPADLRTEMRWTSRSDGRTLRNAMSLTH